MNPKILNLEVQQFINNHLKTDVPQLILKGSKFNGITIQELANQIVAKQKSEKKLPTFFNAKSIYYPNKVNIEQTSSEITAKYKAKLVSGETLIDVTGGFGIDSYYFSKQFEQVTHCEINSDLAKMVTHNFKQLQVTNCTTFSGNGINFLKETTQTFDCIYIDPSRRNEEKGKVFLLKDCIPYLPPKIDFLFTKANKILVKLSPILDISNTIKELKNTKAVHVVAVNNEVKELLFLLEKNYESAIQIKTINLKKEVDEIFNFEYQSAATSVYSDAQKFLYEPNSAILKSGGFHQIPQQIAVSKIQQHTHLYTSESQVNFPGRTFEITAVFPYHKKRINKQITDKKANITVRNFPKTVAQIRKETKLKDGGDTYLFFCKNHDEKLIVIVCKKLQA